jgi:DNA-binding MarR family transcriptional regulator
MADETVKQCASTILDTIHVIWRSVGGEMRKEAPKELSMQQFRAMRGIERLEGPSVSQLAERMGTTLSAASRLVEGLVEKGYVERETAGDDRRRLVLGLTEQGQKELESVHIKAAGFLADKLQAMTPTECAVVNLAMDLLRAQIAASQNEPGKKSSPEPGDEPRSSSTRKE